MDTNTSTARAMIAAYFNQGHQYFSESAVTMFVISEMDPKHAANAAERLVREAVTWAAEAGIDVYPFIWMATTPLVQALHERAEARETPKPIAKALRDALRAEKEPVMYIY
jgi:hypothetical protein